MPANIEGAIIKEDEGLAKLYELTGQYKALQSMVDDESDPQAILDTLESIEGDITDKAEDMAKLMKTIESDEVAIKAEEERLYNRRKALENRRESIKAYLEQQLISVGIEKVKGVVFTVSIQNNAPSLRITNEQVLKDWAYGRKAYWTYKEPEISRKALLDDIKAGAEIPGAEIQQTKSLRVR